MDQGGYVTRVRFADGTESVLSGWGEPRGWPDGVPMASAPLLAAVAAAEWSRPGEPHAGAWLEFRS